VNHYACEYVRDNAHINYIESFWAGTNRSTMEIFHHISKKRLHRYVSEFAERPNMRTMNIMDMIKTIAINMMKKRL